VELDFFQQMEETNVPNVDQASLKVLKAMADVAVADIAAKSSFYLNHVTFLVIMNSN
tara:strand:- start:296 stop:466 length:171 start_codon:yes stop_codon:yes gene_type:complete